MTDDPPDVASLAADLDTAARRRLWLIERVLGLCGAERVASAPVIAARIEEFILSGHISDADDTDRAEGPPGMSRRWANPKPHEGTGAQASPLPSSAPDAPNGAGIDGRYHLARRPLLDRETRERFIREAARNSDNRHLARMFGLSVRQAHAIRVGLSKFISQPHGQLAAGSSKRVARGAPMDREIELKMEEDFLRTKPPDPPTIDDVVRYLRQAGDVVVPNGKHFTVNYRLMLTWDQLIERANAKRRERKQNPFVLATDGMLDGRSAARIGPEHAGSRP